LQKSRPPHKEKWIKVWPILSRRKPMPLTKPSKPFTSFLTALKYWVSFYICQIKIPQNQPKSLLHQIFNNRKQNSSVSIFKLLFYNWLSPIIIEWKRYKKELDITHLWCHSEADKDFGIVKYPSKFLSFYLLNRKKNSLGW